MRKDERVQKMYENFYIYGDFQMKFNSELNIWTVSERIQQIYEFYLEKFQIERTFCDVNLSEFQRYVIA